MGYYDNQKIMKAEISALIDNTQKGKPVPIAPLSIRYGVKFGFGRRSIENVLKEFEEAGRIVVKEKDFEVTE